ncbi:alpha/beta hydrolase family protein [Pseudoduganella sp. OTU4001]|uniref:alpha/beta hydrolase family protein n=1 Tax=Pseudoduganella sp. OTU4001 TaxID=3043854 RepID=UPI00313AD3D5
MKTTLPLLLGAALLAGLPAAAQAASPPPAIETFFEPALIQAAVMSPSTRWVAVVNGTPNGRNRLTMMDLDGKEESKIIATFTRHDIVRVQWVNEDWLVFSLVDNQQKSGKQEYSGLMTVQRNGDRMRELIKRKWGSMYPAGGYQPLEPYNYMVSRGAPGSNEIIVGESHYGPDYQYTHTTLRSLDLASGALRNLPGQPDSGIRISGWMFDAKGKPRAGWANESSHIALYWSDAATGAWKQLGRFKKNDSKFSLGYVDEKDQLYVYARGDGPALQTLRKFDFGSGKPSDEVVVETPGFDTEVTALYDHGDNALVGMHTLADAPGTTWFVPKMRELQAQADAMLPGRVNLLDCGDSCRAPRHVLLYSEADNNPGQYLLYTVATGQWQRLGDARPKIDEKQMGLLDLHRAKTRDGADLPVWITATPSGDNKPRPAIVLVHGGPWARGVTWGWDSEAQFLASRGYVVIQPEFRGSEGYGDRHHRAGWKQWGLRMQDDLNDALKFAVDKGLVDGKRVCIAGASYGGYAALMGVVKNPELYRCAVSWVGVTDPLYKYEVFWSDATDDAKKYYMHDMVGHPERDAEMLKANSPLRQAARIKAPVLLAYGAKDSRVPIVHGEDMRKALIAAGNPPEWIVYDDEGHGWTRPQNQIDFWRKVEAFLARSLK